MGCCMKLTNDYWIEGVSNPRKLHGQCNGVVMKQGNDGNQSKGGGGGGGGGGGEEEKPFCKVAAIPSTLLFAPLTESLLSPSFCNLSEHLANGTSQLYHSSIWQQMVELLSICLFGSSAQ